MLEMIAGKLTALLGPLRAMSKDNREMRDNALRAVSHALNETCIYYRSLRNWGQIYLLLIKRLYAIEIVCHVWDDL